MGAELPSIDKTVGRIQTTVFCAAVRNFHQVHYDDEMCRKQGWKTVLVPGFLMGNWCIEAVTNALGPRAVVRSVRFKMTAVAFVNTPLKVVGVVTGIDTTDEQLTVTCKLRVLDEDDQVVTVATVAASTPAEGS